MVRFNKYRTVPYMRFDFSDESQDEEPVRRCKPKMRITFMTFSSICVFVLGLAVLVLQLIALGSSHWAEYSTIITIANTEEHGHYGLWSICFKNAYRKVEICDPSDTYFKRPPYLILTAILCILHVFPVLLFVLLGFVGVAQIWKNDTNLYIKRSTLCVVEALVAKISGVIAVMALVFSCINVNRSAGYIEVRGWTFWIQVAAVCLDVTNFAISVLETARIYVVPSPLQIDPEGKRAETYGNPTFDANSPELPRSQNSKNGTNKAVAVTETSGHPYDESKIGQTPTEKNIGESEAKNAVPTLTYVNEAFLESSPKPARREK